MARCRLPAVVIILILLATACGGGSSVEQTKATPTVIPTQIFRSLASSTTAPSASPARTSAPVDSSPTRPPASSSSTPAPVSSPARNLTPAQVVEVVDGDTIKVRLNGQVVTVRYIGMDTPETKHPSKPVECFGHEATEANTRLVAGKQIELEKDVSETDQYGRLLRYVWVSGELVNERLVRDGYAAVSTYPPDVKYQDRFLAAQREAREAGRGLWATCGGGHVPLVTPTTAPAPAPAPQASGCPQGCTSPPPGCVIKGNISSSGEKIYHVPGGQFYEATVITPSKGERWFCTEQEALQNGWRRSLR